MNQYLVLFFGLFLSIAGNANTPSRKQVLDHVKQMKSQFKSSFEEPFLEHLNQDNFFSELGVQHWKDATAKFQVVWEETEQHKVLKIIPTDPNQTDIDVQIENGIVKITSQKEIIKDPKNQQRSSYSETFNLPFDVNHEQAEMKREDGQVKVTFPRTKHRPLSPKKLEGGTLEGRFKI